MDYKKFIAVFKEANPGFISFPYTNKDNETSRYTVYIGASYEETKKKDIDTIDNFLKLSDLGYVQTNKYTKADWNNALNELSYSLKNPDPTKSQAQQDAYIPVTEKGTIKWNIETQELYIMGLKRSKVVLEEGEYKVVNSKPITIAKNVIRETYLSTGKWRTFKVKNLEGNIKISGEEIIVE